MSVVDDDGPSRNPEPGVRVRVRPRAIHYVNQVASTYLAEQLFRLMIPTLKASTARRPGRHQAVLELDVQAQGRLIGDLAGNVNIWVLFD
ncbi:unnamed protein product, partial [Mesorhabditis spiculigera]